MKINKKLIISIVLSISFVVVFLVGIRGFFSFDHSIPLDGSNRILNGQIPFKDFDIPYGFFLFYLQAIFSFIFGKNFLATIISAAFLNVVFVYFVYRLLSFLKVESIYLWGGAILSIFSYNFTFGSIWFDNLAFLFCLISIYYMSIAHIQKKNNYYFLSGLMFFFIFMSKQNVALGYLLFFIVPYLLFLLYHRKFKKILVFTSNYVLGIVITLIGFMFFLVTLSSPEIFFKDYFLIPSIESIGRLLGIFARIFYSRNSVITFLFNLTLITLSSLFLVLSLKIRENIKIKSLFLFSFCGISFFHYYFSLNNIGLLLMNIGIQFSLIFELSEKVCKGYINKKWIRILFMGVVIIFISFFCVYSMERYGHDIFVNSDFNSSLESCNVQNKIIWPNSVLNDSPETYNSLCLFVKNISGNFYVFPDSSWLYAEADKINPSRLVWLHRGLTFPSVYDEKVETSLIDEIDNNEIKYIILEKNAISFPHNSEYFVKFKEYRERNFYIERQIGSFEIWKRKD